METKKEEIKKSNKNIQIGYINDDGNEKYPLIINGKVFETFSSHEEALDSRKNIEYDWDWFFECHPKFKGSQA